VILGARVVSLACDICFFSFYLLFTLVAVLRFNFFEKAWSFSLVVSGGGGGD
jgi:hypothetical protein